MPDLLTLGEAMVSLRTQGLVRLGRPLNPSLAGAESNLAIGLARLGHDVVWAGVLGADRFGDLIERTLLAEGVTLVLERADAPTGIVVFEERLPGVVGVDYSRRGSAGSLLSAALVARALEAPPRILHVTGITPALSELARRAVRTAVELAHAAGVLVSLDLNYRGRLWPREVAREELTWLAAHSDLVIASEDELDLAVPASTTDAVGALLASGVGEVVVTAGSAGAALHSESLGAVRAPAHRVHAVDPVGAGDAFAAGYLSGLLDGLPADERLARGAALGAFVVAMRGDWEGLPRRGELGLLGASDGTTLR